MSTPDLLFAAPAPWELATGGYVYDRAIVAGLRDRGLRVAVQELPRAFPEPGPADLAVVDFWLSGVPDVPIVIDGLAYGAMGSVAARHRQRRLIALVHHPLGDETGVPADRQSALLDAELQALDHARGTVVTSPFTARRLESLGLGARRIAVIEPGVQPKPLATGSGGAAVQLLCIASFTPRKGHDVLFSALGRLLDLDWTLTLIGATDLAPAFEAKIRDQAASELAGRVAFVKPVETGGLDAHYMAADLFVLASWYEGYGMVLAEAQAFGLPIVATAGGASADTVRPGAGTLTEPGDVEALATALRRAIGNPKHRAKLAQGARAARSNLPDWPTAASAFADAVERFAG